MEAIMTIKIKTIRPKFGADGNYELGSIGFTYSPKNIISKGIAYFTHWHQMSDIKTSHTFIVTGENECVEAHIQTGVAKRDLRDYFNDKYCLTFFRKQRGLTNDIAQKIVRVANSQIGFKYDLSLILDLLVVHSCVGWSINRRTKGKLEELLTQAHESDHKWICSELAAYCLDQQTEYKDQGILAKPNAAIDPQELFEDDTIFEPWKNQ